MAEHLRTCRPLYELVDSGDVLNVVTRVMHLTRGKLLKQPDWDEWQSLEYLQLNQYDTQGMFGQPVPIEEEMSVFHFMIWIRGHVYHRHILDTNFEVLHQFCSQIAAREQLDSSGASCCRAMVILGKHVEWQV